MAYKTNIRHKLATAIDAIVTIKDTELRLKALLGVKRVVDELHYDLSLLIGELVALKEINNTTRNKDNGNK